MKKAVVSILITSLFLVLLACNKEDPMPVSARFTTNIQNNTLASNKGFTVYTSETKGEFLTYFKGDKESTSWGTGFGTSIEVGTDSVLISAFGAVGSFTFTLVATSYGDWGESMAQDVQSVDITVVAPQ